MDYLIYFLTLLDRRWEEVLQSVKYEALDVPWIGILSLPLTSCDIVTYNMKYIFGLCPCFWQIISKTLVIS